MVKVGVVGLGTMGWRIAKVLSEDGLLAGVYNRTTSKAREFSQQFKVPYYETPRELASNVDALISIVADDEAVKSVALGSDGALAGLKRGSLLIEMSTISPETSIEIAREAKARGVGMVDAPIVGTSVFVERREAVVLVGGDYGDYLRAREVVSHFAREVIYVGPNGYGLYAKLVNNALLGAYVAALAEAVNLGLRLGLSGEVIQALLARLSSARSPTSELKVPKMLSRDYSTQFALRHIRKDLDIAVKEASRARAPLPITSLALEIYRIAESMGLGEMDFSSVFELISGNIKAASGPGSKA